MLCTRIAIASVSAAGVFLTSELGAYFTALLLFLLAVLWIWLWLHQRINRLQSERARRATLLMEGSGEPVSPTELRQIELAFTVTRAEGRKREDPNYFAALAEPSEKRLAEMLEQGAFPPGTTQAGVRVLCVLLSLLLSAEVIGAAFAYTSAAGILATIIHRLDTLNARSYPRADMLLLLSD